MIEISNNPSGRTTQGDLIRDVDYLEYAAEEDGVLELSRIVFPLVIVLTQDCDLQQDEKFRSDEKKNDDKLLLSVLVAPVYNVEHVHSGNHLDQLGLQMTPVPRGGNTGNFLRNNERPRYHYLEFPAGTELVPSVIDFKHYFSVNLAHLNQLRETAYVCTVGNLFRERITQRFSNFLARIGLPDMKVEETKHRAMASRV